MKKIEIKNYSDAVNFLNERCGYIDVENDEDYTKKEIMRLAKLKLKSGDYT